MDTEQITAILASLGVGTWLGNTITKYIEKRGAAELKKLEIDGDATKKDLIIKDLEEDKEKLSKSIEELKEQATKLDALLKEEQTDKIKAEQQLATINVAFDIIYRQLKNILGDDENNSDLLKQLKSYIDGTPNRNIT